MRTVNSPISNNKIVNDITSIQNTASMGAILLNKGKISVKDIERIIALQKQKGLHFGTAAKVLGLINDDDIQKVLSQQFDFPLLTASEEHFSHDLIAAYQSNSQQVVTLRAIRGHLMMHWFINNHKTLTLASPNSGTGCSNIAANLAIIFAQLGERTLLIDANLQQPKQHELFKLANGFGLSDVLAGRADLSVIKKVPVFRDLSIFPAGTIPPNAPELISRGLKNLLEQVQIEFDVILIDTPPAEQGNDAQIIASICGGSLVVVRKNETRFNDLQQFNDALHNADSECLGVIMADF